MSGTLLIHRFKCPQCNSIARADRTVKCLSCGTEMQIDARTVGEIQVTNSE